MGASVKPAAAQQRPHHARLPREARELPRHAALRFTKGMASSLPPIVKEKAPTLLSLVSVSHSRGAPQRRAPVILLYFQAGTRLERGPVAGAATRDRYRARLGIKAALSRFRTQSRGTIPDGDALSMGLRGACRARKIISENDVIGFGAVAEGGCPSKRRVA